MLITCKSSTFNQKGSEKDKTERMKLLILLLALSCLFSLALPSKDVLERSICKRLRAKGMCKSRFNCIKDDLCNVTCGCKDILSVESCKLLKEIKACYKNLAVGFDYCRWTCGFCWRTPCNSTGALGMQNRAIPDSSITASSSFSSNNAPQQGRLYYKQLSVKYGAWSAKTKRAGDWLQVDLGNVTKVQGVATQGRYDSDQWVASYTLQYSDNGKTFKKYQGGKVFKGNNDRNTVVKNDISPPIYGRYIRVVVKTYYGWPSMRMELYGCKYY